MNKSVTAVGLILAGVLLSLYAASGVFAAPAQSITISETDFELTPAVFDVVAGQPVQVTVTNNGKVQHNLTFELPSKNIEKTLLATNLNPGETRSAEYIFSEAGDWEVYCPVPGHEDAGMKGVVHVSAATTAPAGGANSTTGTPTALPTSGADFTNIWTLIAGIVGALLIAFGLGIGQSARQR